MAPKPAVVEEQPINALPYYPVQQQQQQQQFQANYNPNLAWYQQAPSLQPNLLIPNIQQSNNISHNGGIITDPIRRLKIQTTNLSGVSCCCFMLFLLFAAIVCGLLIKRSSLVVDTNVYCYYTNGKLNTISYDSYVATTYRSHRGYYAQSTISGGLSSTDVIACSLTTRYDYISRGYFIFYYTNETYDLCLNFNSEPSTSTRCTTSEALQYTEPCEEIDYDPASCENTYQIMMYENYENSEIYITTAQGVNESYVAFVLNYTLVYDIEEEENSYFYASFLFMAIAFIVFCCACLRCVYLRKKLDKAPVSSFQF